MFQKVYVFYSYIFSLHLHQHWLYIFLEADPLMSSLLYSAKYFFSQANNYTLPMKTDRVERNQKGTFVYKYKLRNNFCFIKVLNRKCLRFSWNNEPDKIAYLCSLLQNQNIAVVSVVVSYQRHVTVCMIIKQCTV